MSNDASSHGVVLVVILRSKRYGKQNTSTGCLLASWSRVTNPLGRRGFTLARMERTWSGTLSRSAPGSPRRPPKMAMCETEKRRMTHPMSVCRGSVLPQNAHEDCTTPHVRRMTARRLPKRDPALGGRARHEKSQVGLSADRWTTEKRSTVMRVTQVHTSHSACGSIEFVIARSVSAGFHL